MLKSLFFWLVLMFSCLGFAQDIKHNPWSLIIYRPENVGQMNDVRCWLKLEDFETGEDVTYVKATAKYEWIPDTKVADKKNPQSFTSIFKLDRISTFYKYKKTYFLSGGMAMHLNLKPGKYKISVYTPKDKTNLYPCDNKDDWLSNQFVYNTENPAKVIFVIPTHTENGFYAGGWIVDYKAPQSRFSLF